jgi:hypothetical protein
MLRRRFIGLCGVGLGGVAGVMLARAFGGARRPPARASSADQLVLSIEQTGPLAGELRIRAAAKIGPLPVDHDLCWYVDVRRIDPVSGQMASTWSQEYGDQWFQLQAGRKAAPTFAERLEMPAGRYSVLVGLRESRPTLNEHGVIAQPHSSVGASSRVLTVR